MPTTARTLLDKIWDDHVVCSPAGELPLLYIDRHLVHEVTSPQAFEGLRLAGRKVRRPEATFATPDHNVPTSDRRLPIADPISKQQIDTLRANCREFGVRLFDLDDADQGIVHVIGPELGITQPGMTIVCGDSHTATHGALGSLAFGIGTSEVEHVLATQTLRQAKPKSLELRVEGRLPAGVTAKDIVLYLIGRLSTEGGVGHVIEYTGECIRSLGMEQRMTVCNMSIEAGARAGMIAPDAITFDYLRGRDLAPKGAAFDAAVARWEKLPSDPGAAYDRVEIFKAADVVPQVTWGTNPAQVTGTVCRFQRPLECRAGARLHGPHGRHADRRHPARPRVHRVVHQQPDRRPSGGSGRRSRLPRGADGAGDGGSGQRSREAAGRGRRA